jgi:hypothetical protein
VPLRVALLRIAPLPVAPLLAEDREEVGALPLRRWKAAADVVMRQRWRGNGGLEVVVTHHTAVAAASSTAAETAAESKLALDGGGAPRWW